MQDTYAQYLKSHQHDLEKQESASKILGYAKLCILVLLLWGVWRVFQAGPNPLLVIGAVSALVTLVGFWLQHNRVLDKIQYHRGHIRIVQEYLARIDGTWTQFADNGAEYVDRQHPYSYDLDLFGRKSLFQFLCVAGTYHGRERLSRDLQNPQYTEEQIHQRQQAVRELAGNTDFCHDFQYYASLLRNQDGVPGLLEHLNRPDTFLRSEWAALLLRYMPIVFAPPSLLIFALQVQSLYITATALLGVMVLCWLLFAYRSHQYLRFVEKAQYGLGNYSKLFLLIQQETFACAQLRSLQGAITSGSRSATTAIKQLDRIVDCIDLRRNGIVYFVLNALLLWDIRCSLDVQAWKTAYSGHFDRWLDSLGTLESLLSLSVLENTVQGTSYPVFSDSGRRLEAQGLGHPLIPDQKRVCNDYTLQDGITVISGSNMSGKTTFMRTVGINIVLAKCGACVCAQKLLCSNFQIVSSMRIVDDLHEGVSSFYAELKNIRAILNLARTNGKVLFLIDEIFRGTNSDDRIAGAKAVMQSLYEMQALGFLTTHDLQLCRSNRGVHINNWHFSEQYRGRTLTFDYTIKRGIATSTNGQYLMRMLGIMREPDNLQDRGADEDFPLAPG